MIKFRPIRHFGARLILSISLLVAAPFGASMLANYMGDPLCRQLNFTAPTIVKPAHSAACPWVTDHLFEAVGAGGSDADLIRSSRCWEPT